MNLEEQLRALIDAVPAHIQRHFACDCAEQALEAAHIQDKRLWGAVLISRCFAEGKVTVDQLSAAQKSADEAINEAGDETAVRESRGAQLSAMWNEPRYGSRCAAWNAAHDAAKCAAHNAAQNMVWSAAFSAAWHVTRNKALDTTWRAVWEKTWATNREWQIAHLQSLIAAHNAARSSLLYIVQKRSESIKPVFVQYAHDLEERTFE